MSYTMGASYNDIVLATSPGGSLEEWSIGTSIDVFEFFNNAGGDGSYKDTNNTTLQIALYLFWGQANHSGTRAPLDSWWHVKDVTPGGSTSGMLWSGESYVYTYSDDFSDPNDEYPAIATALYRQAVVPLPATGWLFMSALLGLVGRKQLLRR
ncbi:MAG: hypothetical protein EX270_06260 [Pseudomonadales bacterium]|nr:MAG: hypothetical protein EX270_06260 [Pseudomonadales bacterium]